MKRSLLVYLSMAALVVQSHAAWITYSNNTYAPTLANSGYVPDGDLNGWASTMSLSSIETVGAGGVQVALNISGGWNGDLYGYLTHDSGFVVLLNRVGTSESNPYGYNNNGFSVALVDGGVGSTINSGGSYSPTTPSVLTGTYRSQGDTGSAGLDQSFLNTSVGGQWTLFLADRSFGDQSQVMGWSLTIDAVPEPTTWAMMIFGATFAGWRFWSWRVKQC